MVVTRSRSGYTDTVARLIEAITSRGMTVFARIDHAAGAREVELELRPEEVVLFGSPRAGTPLMQSDPRVGIELPLHILVWEDGDGAALGYHDPRELAARYDLAGREPALETMASLLEGLARQAAGLV